MKHRVSLDIEYCNDAEFGDYGKIDSVIVKTKEGTKTIINHDAHEEAWSKRVYDDLVQLNFTVKRLSNTETRDS